MTNANSCYVGLSGGVDSSVAAYLLKGKGYAVQGVYANCFSEDAECRNIKDHDDAVHVASILGIKLETMDYRKDYYNKVLRSFYTEYDKGRTPNPDILCNSEVKFGVMANDIFAKNPTACLATGHYVGNVDMGRKEFVSLFPASRRNKVSIERVAGLLYKGSKARFNFMLSGLDVAKDQSYFLYRLYDKSENLARYIFPLSEMTKKSVRRIAARVGLNTAGKPDSQGICFIGNVKLADFIKNRVKGRQGDVINIEGEIVGTHSGIQFYTLGQRHGFTIKKYSGSPLYIVGKIPSENILVVGRRPEACSGEFVISDISFPYSIENFLEEFNGIGLSVRVRNLGKKIPCEVFPVAGQNGDRKNFRVKLSISEFGIAPGQSAVFYVGRLMLGGGVIESTDSPYKHINIKTEK